MSDGYRQIGSFESNRVDAVGVGDGAIAVGVDDRVIVVTGDGRVEIDHGEQVIDIALADHVLILSAGVLTIYSLDGDRIRQQPAADAHAIATIAEADLVGVLGPDRLRAVDIATGRERFDVERARPGGPADDGLLGTPTGFVLSTWSFLTRIDPDGEVGFDRNLEAVVRSLGRCDDSIVAALQNDRLVAADLETGQSRWQTELAVEHVAPVGDSSVLVTTADGIRAVDSEGETASVAGLSSGDGYATADGSLVCAIRDGTVSIYVHSRDQIRLAVATNSVGVGGTIDIEVTNATDRERRVSLAASVDGATLSPSERTMAVEASETMLVDFPVESVRSEGEQMFELSVNGATVEETMLDLDDAASGGIAVETDLEAATIDHGVAKLAVTVENVGGVALEDVRLLETDTGTDALEPGEEWTGTVTRPYEPDRRVSVGLEVARGARRREYAPTCTLPPAPTIDVESDGDAVRATIETDGSATVADRLVIELPGAGRVRTDVTLERDELLLVVPQFDDGTARIGFESIDVDERVKLSDVGPGTHSRSSGIGGTRLSGTNCDDSARTNTDQTEPDRIHDGTEPIGTDSLEPMNADQSVRSEKDAESAASAADSDTADDDSGPSTDESIAAADRSDTGIAISDDRSTVESPVDDTSSPTEPTGSESGAVTESPVRDTGTADAAQGNDRSTGESTVDDDNTAEPRITATRRIADEAAPIGHAIRDRIDLENVGQSAVAVSVDVGESTVDVGRLKAGERTALERTVAVLSGDETTLSPVTVKADGAVHADLSDRTITASDDGVAVRATVDPGDGSVVAEFENCDDQPYWIRGLEAAGHTIALDARLAPGESATATGSPDRWTDPNTDALEGSLVVADEDGGEHRVNIVATVSSVTADSNDGDDPFEISIGPETKVAGEYGTVVLVFKNGGDRPLSDVAVSASGEPINELFYSEARRERLAVGDRIEHFVDIEPDVTDPSFDATMAYTLEDAAREYTVRTAGPSAEDETAWTDHHRERWSVERVEDESTDPTVPSSLSTPFRLE